MQGWLLKNIHIFLRYAGNVTKLWRPQNGTKFQAHEPIPEVPPGILVPQHVTNPNETAEWHLLSPRQRATDDNPFGTFLQLSWQIWICQVFLWPCAVFLHVACKTSLCGVIHMPCTARWCNQCRMKFRKPEIAFYLIVHPFSRQTTTCAGFHTFWCIFLFPIKFVV